MYVCLTQISFINTLKQNIGKMGKAWKHSTHEWCQEEFTFQKHAELHIINCSTARPQTFTRLRVLRLTGKELILDFIAYIFLVRHFSPYVSLASLSSSKCSQAFHIFRCSCSDQEWRPENKATHNPLARINTSTYKFVRCCLATEFLDLNNTEWNG